MSIMTAAFSPCELFSQPERSNGRSNIARCRFKIKTDLGEYVVNETGAYLLEEFKKNPSFSSSSYAIYIEENLAVAFAQKFTTSYQRARYDIERFRDLLISYRLSANDITSIDILK